MLTRHGNDYASIRHAPKAILDTRELREEVAIRYANSGQGYEIRTLEGGRRAGEQRLFKNGAPAIMKRSLVWFGFFWLK